MQFREQFEEEHPGLSSEIQMDFDNPFREELNEATAKQVDMDPAYNKKHKTKAEVFESIREDIFQTDKLSAELEGLEAELAQEMKGIDI